MKIKTFEAGPLSANNYLLTDNGESVLIDCSDYKPEIFDGVNLKYIILTHGHFDHVLGVNHTKQATEAKVLVNESDVERMQESSDIMKSFGALGIETPKADQFIKDGDIIKFGNVEIKAIHTPGHTQGSMSYLIDDILFSGDTIFKDCFGRCDLPGGNFEDMRISLDKLLKLDDNIKIYSGHGEVTTIGYEKQHNEINNY